MRARFRLQEDIRQGELSGSPVSSEELGAQAATLNDLIRRFRIDENAEPQADGYVAA